MKEVSNHGENLSSVSIRKAPARKYVTDTNQDEKVQQPILDIDALRAIGRIVRAIKERIEASQRSETGSDPEAHGAGDNSGSGAASQDRSQAHGRGDENK